MIFNNGYDRGYSSVEEIVPPMDADGNYILESGQAFGPVKPEADTGESYTDAPLSSGPYRIEKYDAGDRIVDLGEGDAEQQRRFVVLLRTLLEDTYMTAIESYTSEQINFGDEKIKGKKAVVNVSILLTSGAEAPLLFKLRNKGGDWFVYDVVIEGVSLVSTFRSNFSSIVKRDGVDGLLERLEQKMKQS